MRCRDLFTSLGLHRRCFAFLHQNRQHLPDLDGISRPRPAGGYSQNPLVKRFNVLCRFLPFEHEQCVSRFDEIAVAFQPFAERPLVHRPPQAGHNNFDRHFNYSSQ